MTPAINLLKKSKIRHLIHEYHHDPNSRAYGEEAADRLNLSYAQIFKTLVVCVNNNDLMVAVVPVSKQLDLKFFAKAVKAKKAVMASRKDVERSTGYLLGGVSTIGQKKKLKTLIDNSARNFETIYVSAGRRGLQVELAPDDLASQISARFFPSGWCSGEL